MGDDKGIQESSQPRRKDRAEAAGFPPDFGPEKQVLVLRPALFRSHPFATTFLALFPIGAGAGIVILGAAVLPVALIVSGALALIFWVGLVIWWVRFSLGRSLEITNKRTVEHIGLLSRMTTEVLHDHIRNIQIHQTFGQRIMGVGKIGLSSSADTSVEIEMTGVPNPHKARKVIDLYRPLD